jgi:hypothetical protein
MCFSGSLEFLTPPSLAFAQYLTQDMADVSGLQVEFLWGSCNTPCL